MTNRLVTINIRYDKPDPGVFAWSVRLKAVAELLRDLAPDLIGTQEVTPHQLEDLQHILPAYRYIGADRNGNGTGEYGAIFYHPERMQCLAAGDFWLSGQPDRPGSISPEWGNPLPRMTTWGLFTDVVNGRKLALFNTHLDYQSARSRQLSAQLICQQMAKIAPEDAYILLTGDFNDSPLSATRHTFVQPLSNGVQLQDALSRMPQSQQMTFHDFRGRAFAAIDSIYYDRRLHLRAVKIDSRQFQGLWPSDHFPVVADFD